MYKKYLLLIVSILSLNTVRAQEKEISKEESELIYKITYGIYKSHFVQSDFIYITVAFEPSTIFATIKSTNDVLMSSVDTLRENAEIKIEKGSFGWDLILRSRFPVNMDQDDLNKLINLKVVESKLYSTDNHMIKIKDGGATNIGSRSSSRFENGKQTNLSYKTINRQSPLDKDQKLDSVYKGSVVYEIEFLTDYYTQKLSKKNIAKTFKFNTIEYKLVDIIDNKAILEIIKRDNEKDEPDLYLLNFDKKGNLLKPYSHFELVEMNKKDKNIGPWFIYKKQYES